MNIVPAVFFGMPGGWEWIIILVIVLIVFGAGKLPKVGRSVGEAITEFKEGINSKDGDDDDTMASSGGSGDGPEHKEA